MPEFHNKTMFNAAVEYNLGQFSARSNDRNSQEIKTDPSDFNIQGKDLQQIIHSQSSKIPVRALPSKMTNKITVNSPFDNLRGSTKNSVGGSRNAIKEALSSRSNTDVRIKSFPLKPMGVSSKQNQSYYNKNFDTGKGEVNLLTNIHLREENGLASAKSHQRPIIEKLNQHQ